MSHSFFGELWFIIKSLFASKPSDKESSELLQMKHFPFDGYAYMQWCGYLMFTKDKFATIDEESLRHETIHLKQAQDKGTWVKFYLSYLWNWLKHDPIFHYKTAYYLNKYEVEAYAKEGDTTYLERREKNAADKFKFSMDYCSFFSYNFKQKVKETFKDY